MRLYLVQHGDAVSEDKDPQRPLSEKGRTDVKKTAEFLKRSGITVSAIWHSSKLRSKQTAEILIETLNAKTIKEKNNLTPNDRIDDIFEQISLQPEDILITGHLPFLSKLASKLLTDSEYASLISFRMGGVVCLEKDTSNHWKVVFVAIPELLG